MKPCFYCYLTVDTEEMDALYMIDEQDERVFWCHTECVEIYENLIIHQPVEF